MDRRQQKTRQAIFDAFTALLSQKNYNQIAVQEIIDTANVGRTTFYAHFETKDYLLKELCEELFDHILAAALGRDGSAGRYADCEAPDSVFLHLIGHLQQNDNHILDLLSSQNNDIFQRYFKSNLKNLIAVQYADRPAVAASGLPVDYIVNHLSAAFVETVDWWLSRRMQDPPEVITAYFLKVTEPFTRPEEESAV